MPNSVDFFDFSLPRESGITVWSGLPGASRSLAISEACRKSKQTFLVVCSDSIEAERIYKEIIFFSGGAGDNVYFIPDTETLPYDFESPHNGIISQRARAFHSLSLGDDKKIVVMSVSALAQRISKKEHWASSFLHFSIGMKVCWSEIIDKLSQMGYKPEELEIDTPGSFAIRNDIVDIYPIGESSAFRIRMSDDVISIISKLNISTQKSSGNIDYFNALPAKEMPTHSSAISKFRQNYRREFGYDPKDPVYEAVGKGIFPAGIESFLPLFQDDVSTLFDYLPSGEGTQVVIMGNVFRTLKEFWNQVEARYLDLKSDSGRKILNPERLWVTETEFKDWLAPHSVIMMAENQLPNAPVNCGGELTMMSRKPNLVETTEMLSPWLSRAKKTLFSLSSSVKKKDVEVICQLCGYGSETYVSWDSFIESPENEVGIIISDIEQGFFFPGLDILVVTEKDLFGKSIFESEEDDNRMDEVSIEKNLEGLQLNEPIVHMKYGVGRFNKLTKMSIDGVEREYLTIKYDKDAIAYVKMEDLDMVTRYTGLSIDNAPFDEMGSDKWLNEIDSTVEGIKKTAVSLLKLKEEKKKEIGIAFNNPGYDYYRFCNDFEFKETVDQRAAGNDILADMMSSRPMDRLICGDVGFGKTEVAMRAAFIAAKSGYQVAIMVPTTLLSNQHYESFLSRFEGYGLNIACLSGLESKTEEKELLLRMGNGSVDIVIGTQRLIQEDIEFASLGLLIIDEEHRFGVKDKEKLKGIRQNIDSLSLTATPIPRTMSMAMHGIRDVSIIATPPQKRLSIKTFIENKNESIIKEAIQREMMRGGQVFYLHNRVGTIKEEANKLQSMIPRLRVSVVHGQMSELELERVMSKFYKKEIDLIVCTTIIENGINVTNANTIIIDSADKLGLAQLHQLRGRVGRSNRQAYAYMLMSENPSVSGRERLEAIRQTTKLGEGFLLANHDLEIRGAGEILGEDQSGHMMKIGTTLYFRLLDRAIKALNENESLDDLLESKDINIDINISGVVDSSYISSESARLSIYKRLVSAEDLSELKVLQDEISDRFGPIPEKLRDLINISRLRWYLSKIGVKKLMANKDSGIIELRKNHALDQARLIDMVNESPGVYQLMGPYLISFKKEMPDKKTRLSNLMMMVAQLIKQRN